MTFLIMYPDRCLVVWAESYTACQAMYPDAWVMPAKEVLPCGE